MKNELWAATATLLAMTAITPAEATTYTFTSAVSGDPTVTITPPLEFLHSIIPRGYQRPSPCGRVSLASGDWPFSVGRPFRPWCGPLP